MKVAEIMTPKPACCGPHSSVEYAARLMAENDCGEIPVLDSSRRPMGVLTDRDIAIRAVAQGKGPDTPVIQVMSMAPVTASPNMTVEECCRRMTEHQVRRIPVVDEQGGCCGIVAQADLARAGLGKELVEQVSRPRSIHPGSRTAIESGEAQTWFR